MFGTLFWSFVVAVGALLGAVSMARGVRAWMRGEKYIGNWLDGAWFKGRAINPRLVVGGNLVFLGGFLYLSWAVYTGRLGSEEFVFRTPDGWVDVSEHAPSENLAQFPDATRAALRESAKHVHFLAVHPVHDDESRLATLIMLVATRHFGSSRIDDARLEQMYGEAWDAPSKKKGGWRATKRAQSMAVVGGRTIGTLEVDLERPDGTLRVFHYVVPGDKQVVLLGCMVPIAWVEHYRAVCDDAAALTVRANAN